ncbi:MAG TPA: sigma-70 family RNA polymerase sigma factor [Candidatus Limnocylindria bacterium]|nr:sigma-70 family RNA polymerase sigma factor [Candidatus Limnocylindria bacterium]
MPRVVSTADGEDAGLVARIAAGDAVALGDLYVRHGRVVFAVAQRVVGSPEVAEEVVQDAFHSVWRAARSYRADRGSVRTWLLTIARNAAVDRRRRMGRVTRDGSLDEALRISDGIAVDERVIVRIRDGRVREVVRSLPEEQRQVLDLAFWGGLSQSEISARTGVPLGTVKSRVRLAMAKLRDGLAEERSAS